ncbi:glycosyltransferase [Mucilaginibacter achroorhodeus]|uniref:Glycosyltransferase n=1 Tax=Mucilaginibacter achroorhodeus TaxID=2599294 RepID=A0A563U9C3_9SPHI|nr:glycosyltransferase family 2 protein [Mucilaginibacter achroorhodeus]TWR27940.1 glycosyltransferase [Mucilaginibacter achroorhodeus]
MEYPKISIITVCYNAVNTIERCIRSVINQNYPNVEYIIIDGGSTDGTVDIISKFYEHIAISVSEKDQGIYDALNKGLKLSSGEIVGALNADDFLSNENILTVVYETFSIHHPYIVYGDLDYLDGTGKIIRKWRSGKYKKGSFNFGWMPPHPTFYCKRELFENLGNYSLAYGSAADYELMTRFIHKHKLAVHYIPVVMVKMMTGGVSNSSMGNRLKALAYDFKAMYKNRIIFPPMALLLKPLRKIKQFF